MNKRLRLIGFVVGSILLVPLVAMQFTDEVNWGILDFIIAGFLLFSTGLILDLIIRKIKRPSISLLLAFMVLIIFLLIWAELAVGIFGTPFSGN